MSSFSWLDYSERERRVVLDVIDKFREHETRDELGLASIRDGFADLFFPGTGTVQTRPRYLFFIPWLYQRLEAKKVESAEIKGRARRDELALVETLLRGSESEGVIGRQARATLKRLPSNIYWQGLGALGIRINAGSQEQYHRSLDRFYRDGGLSMRSDDGELLNRTRARNWHSSLPKAPSDFPAAATLDLTNEEAAFLREQVAHAAPDSILRYFIARDKADDLENIEFPWEHPGAEELPTALQEQLEHARNFSEVLHGASLLYNRMLAEKRGDEAWIADYGEALEDWGVMMDERRDAHQAWSLDRFWSLINGCARVSISTRAFIDQWLALTLADARPPVLGSHSQRILVTTRERQLKHLQARLTNQRALELWRGQSGTGRLTYRWAVARRLLADVQTALNAEPTSA